MLIASAAKPALADEHLPHVPVRSAVKTRLLELLSVLNESDPQAAIQAREELQLLGLDDRQIEYGRMLVDADPGVRARLAHTVLEADQQTRSEVMWELTYDPSQKVRVAVLESLRRIDPGPELKRRVRELAESDADSVVRGYARLLMADWSGGATFPADGFPPGEERERSGLPQTPTTPPDEQLPDDRPLRNASAASNEVAAPTALQTVQPYWDRSAPVEPVGWAASTSPQSVGTAHATSSDSNLSLLQGPVAQGAPQSGETPELSPDVLKRPIESPFVEAVPPIAEEFELLTTPIVATTGFAGRSGVLPTESQESSHFVPVPDRWRTGFPDWDRYGKGHPWVDDYPYVKGHWWDPFNQNVLKGDYPIIGQHTFLNVTATLEHVSEVRQVPTATTPFESTFNPFQEEFFGDPEQFFHTTFLKLRFDLFHGSEAFKPLDWQIRVTPVFNRNYLRVHELGIVNPDVRKGRRRTRHDFALEEWFVEAKLADLSPHYDFMSVRAGSQFFNSDFRGFIFSDTNRAIRLFGTRLSNRDQFNVIWFDQTEKETNSELNTYDDRHQNTLIVNYYRQDFVFPGYTAQLSFHYNRDQASFKFDENDFLVRPDPAGVFRPHEVESYYFGIAGDGHIRRVNISNALYWVVGTDHLNPIAGEKQSIDAKMAAVELSVDRDWVRFRTSWFYASGDDDVFDNKARGFDAIFDNPNFAGGEFSYWQRQAIRLFGVNLVQRKSLIPNLRSSKIQGQSNFVNPGLSLVNAGMDFEITPKLRALFNANYLWFNTTHPLEIFTFQDKIDPEIGTDVSIGVEYRPFLNDNAIIVAGFATFIPGKGFDDLFGIPKLGGIFHPDPIKAEQMYSNFLEITLTY